MAHKLKEPEWVRYGELGLGRGLQLFKGHHCGHILGEWYLMNVFFPLILGPSKWHTGYLFNRTI